MTNAELMKELIQPGKVYMPVRSRNMQTDEEQTVYLAVEKKDFIAHLTGCLPNGQAAWKFGGKYLDGRKMELRK